jgi:hypothetical protein
MNRQVVSRFLIAMSLTLVIVAGVVGTKANASNVANPLYWCSFYSIQSEPGVMYCGGACIFPSDVCGLQGALSESGVYQYRCTCTFSPDSP